MAPVPIPDEAKAVLDFWCPRIANLLGDLVLGARLFGSIPLDGFEAAWSDLDVCTILARPVTDEEASAIDALHEELEERFLHEAGGIWRSTQLFEGPYLPESLATRPGVADRCLIVGTGHRVIETGDPVPGFLRYMLANHSVVVLGDPPPFVPDSRAAMARHQVWLPELLSQPAEEHSSIMLAGVLQELARTIVFFRDGRFLAKSAALEEEVSNQSPFAAAYASALRVRRLGSARADEHREELASCYTACAKPARERLEVLLASAD